MIPPSTEYTPAKVLLQSLENIPKKAALKSLEYVSDEDYEDQAINEYDFQLGVVTAEDIVKAEKYGVMAGLQRHFVCQPKLKAIAALDILESLFKSGFQEKVAQFIRIYGYILINELDEPAFKAEFAIRMARFIEVNAEKESWVKVAMELLADKKVHDECAKMTLVTLAMIWAEVGIVDQTLHWLSAAHADHEKYVEATLKFFRNGEFDNGLKIYDTSVEIKTHNSISDQSQRVLNMQIKSFNTAKAVQESWSEWFEDDCENKSMMLTNEIHLLSFFAVFKYLEGDTQGAIGDINDSLMLYEFIKRANPNWNVNFADFIYDAVIVVQRKESNLPGLKNMILNTLACNPLSCEKIFKCEIDLSIVSSLMTHYNEVVQHLKRIAKLTKQTLRNRMIESLQSKKLTAKVNEGLEKVKLAVDDSKDSLNAYKKAFIRSSRVYWVKEIEVLFKQVQELSDDHWSLGKIDQKICPLAQSLELRLSILIEHQKSINDELRALGQGGI
jgi:hypothetical protein